MWVPKVIGKEYLVIGTLGRPDWQRGTQSPMPIREMIEHLHDFKYGALAGAKKGAAEEGRTIVWVDESGFYLLPGLVRTYAPRGQTPILRVPFTRDHVSVISGITM